MLTQPMPGLVCVPSFAPEPAHPYPETFGRGIIVTVAELEVEPPRFVQVRVKVVSVVILVIVCEPLNAPPLAVHWEFEGLAVALHESAPDEDQVNAVAYPETTLVGLADNKTVGAAGRGTKKETTLPNAVPPTFDAMAQ